MTKSIWNTTKIGNHKFNILNMDHPDIETSILSEINSGVDVYYDRRWDVTDSFCQFILENPAWISNRSVLILGSGIGKETIVIGRMAKKLYINDLAPVALDLCALQLKKNNIRNYELLHGRYEEIDCPKADIVIGCYLVYNPETARAMQQFMNKCSLPVLLMNEHLPVLKTFLKKSNRKIRYLLPDGRLFCALFE